jgi:hypothetical protein
VSDQTRQQSRSFNHRKEFKRPKRCFLLQGLQKQIFGGRLISKYKSASLTFPIEKGIKI